MLSIRGGCIMNDINKKGLSTTLLCCLIWGLLPFIGHYLTKFHPFQYYRTASSGLVFDDLHHPCYGLPTTAHRYSILAHTSFTVRLLLLAAALISVNWFTYIWAVTNQHVLDTSLGYYINPSPTYCSASLSTKKPCYGPKS